MTTTRQSHDFMSMKTRVIKTMVCNPFTTSSFDYDYSDIQEICFHGHYPKEINTLVDVLGQAKNLKVFKCILQRGETYDAHTRVFEALKMNLRSCSLRELDLSYCQLGTAGLDILHSNLNRNKSIRILDLTCCQLGDHRGAGAYSDDVQALTTITIADMIKELHLDRIDLGLNMFIGDVKLGEFTPILHAMMGSKLKWVCFCSCDIDWSEFTTLLKSNTTIKFRVLDMYDECECEHYMCECEDDTYVPDAFMNERVEIVPTCN